MSIQELFSKIKGMKDMLERQDIFMILTIILVGFISFGLGRLSTNNTEKNQISLVNDIQKTQSAVVGNSVANSLKSAEIDTKVSENALVQTSEQVVASKSGTKYHYPWCSGAKTIKEENKIWFSSTDEARSAGYSPANNCKGLK